MQIYLDYSATTPPRPEVIAAVQAVMTEQWGNASSLHEWGSRSAMLLEEARFRVAGLIHASPDSVAFTAGGTEADNLAIMGVARRYRQPQHIITSAVEHSAISRPAAQLEQEGWKITRLPVDSRGQVNAEALQAALQPNTVLVSIIHGQSEVGTLQPIEQLGQIVRSHGSLFHTDSVQVAGRLPINLEELPVDLMSLSSHKIYGPQGAGALFVRSGVELVPLISGGGQEFSLRSGTQAIPNIVGFGVAADLAAREMPGESLRLIGLRDRLFELLSDCPDLAITGDRRQRLPHHASFCITTADGERVSGKTLVRQMNMAGIGISAGSACHSGKLSPSPVLEAMGYSHQAARCGIRLTFGKQTTIGDIDWTAAVLRQLLERLIAPLKCCTV